jgi:N-acetylmuramoyl-L-alanine amidase
MRMRRSFAALCLLACASVMAAEVAIDVGHHLAEPGAISARGRAEFEFNLELARQARAALEQAGLRVRMIGERGDATLLLERAGAAQGADLLVSIHHDSVQERLLEHWMDAGVPRRHSDRFAGFSLFVSRANPHPARSLACAASIGARLRSADFAPSRYHADPLLGESRPFADEANGVHWFDNLTLVRSAPIPALLLEAGVIVNREEELRLRDPAVIKRIAGALAEGVKACLQ